MARTITKNGVDLLESINKDARYISHLVSEDLLIGQTKSGCANGVLLAIARDTAKRLFENMEHLRECFGEDVPRETTGGEQWKA